MKLLKRKEQGTTPEVESRFKVLGSGCKKCLELEKNTIEALDELGLKDGVQHVYDFKEIAKYGVMSTPALVIDDKVVSYGKVINKEEISKLLKENS